MKHLQKLKKCKTADDASILWHKLLPVHRGGKHTPSRRRRKGQPASFPNHPKTSLTHSKDAAPEDTSDHLLSTRIQTLRHTYFQTTTYWHLSRWCSYSGAKWNSRSWLLEWRALAGNPNCWAEGFEDNCNDRMAKFYEQEKNIRDVHMKMIKLLRLHCSVQCHILLFHFQPDPTPQPLIHSKRTYL